MTLSRGGTAGSGISLGDIPSDASAATPSLRSLGTGPAQALTKTVADTLYTGGVSGGPASAAFLYPEDYGAVGDVVVLADVATTASSAVVTSASASFTNADVGKRFSIQGAGSAQVAVHTTIASRQSASQVTLSTALSQTITAGWASYGTDDTTALQNCINAAVTGRRRVQLSKRYGTTLELSIGGACSINGTGSYGVFGNFGNGTTTGKGPGVPWTSPYVAGCGIHVMASGLRSAVAITAEAAEVNLNNFCVVFAAPFWSTGHGFYAPAGATNAGNGVPNVCWQHLKVFGVDGSSYAYWFENPFQIQLQHLRYWGGGGYFFRQNNGIWAFGNSQLSDCTGKTFIGGTVGPITISKGGGGPLNQMSFLTAGANAVNAVKYGFDIFNGRTTPALSGSQKLIDAATANINGLSLIGSTWDGAGTSIAQPSLPSAKGPSGGAGLFVDPGGFFVNASSFDRMIIGPNGGAIPYGMEYVSETTSDVTAASPDYEMYAVDATTGNRTVTLVALAKGSITIKKTDATANTVTVAAAGTDKIDGVTSGTVTLTTQGQTVRLVGGTTGWFKA